MQFLHASGKSEKRRSGVLSMVIPSKLLGIDVLLLLHTVSGYLDSGFALSHCPFSNSTMPLVAVQQACLGI